jgi:MFS transporter, BCD family, chlorophyll transporter
VQASGAGLGVALGGIIRDAVAYAALNDALGATLAHRATGYAVVYGLEILLLLAALVVLGPVVAVHRARRDDDAQSFGLSEFPT